MIVKLGQKRVVQISKGSQRRVDLNGYPVFFQTFLFETRRGDSIANQGEMQRNGFGNDFCGGVFDTVKKLFQQGVIH